VPSELARWPAEGLDYDPIEGRVSSAAFEEARAAAFRAVVVSPAAKRLVVAGPGTGKTTLFKQLLQADGGPADKSVVLTFINNLADELRRDLGTLA
jgi:hypothetical protein